jgi:hypothetical protein
MNYPGLKPWVSQVKDLKCLRFAPGGHSSPSLKARGFLADFIKIFNFVKNDDLVKSQRAKIGLKFS